MRKTINMLAVGVAVCTALLTARADFAKTNPVTGETENYRWKFTGTDTWNDTRYWQDSSGANPSGVPAKSGSNQWEPILFDGNTININAGMSVEGWDLRMGVYNGARIQLNNLAKLQGDTTMWMTVDETSQLTIGGFGKGNIADNQVIKLSTAKASGIAWNVNLESTGNANNTFEYYLKGAGSVSYQAVSAAKHKIKRADVTLSGGAKSVQSKTLVSFTSSTKTFWADAVIKRLDSNGDDLGSDVLLAMVNTTGATTLTADNDTGACELVQTSTGIVLYWVDGDPADLVEKTYLPSISVNFTDGSASSLTTAADVGVEPYAIPGTSWNNLYAGNNSTLSSVTRVDSTGRPIAVPGARVTVSGTRGPFHYYGVPDGSDLRRGYIDDNGTYSSPQVAVEGIPYEAYTPVLYFSNDEDGRKFGYLTVNGVNYTWSSASGKVVVCEGVEDDCWGSSGGGSWREGGNYLVLPVQTAGSLTVIGHRFSGTKRMGVAAVQFVEYTPPVYTAKISAAGTVVFSSLVWDETPSVSLDSAKLVVNVTEDATLNIDNAVSALGVEFNVASGKTLTLSGDTVTAGAIGVNGAGLVVAGGASQLVGTLRGNGNLAYPMGAPSGLVTTDSAWTGFLWTKNAQDEMVAVPADTSVRSLATLAVPTVPGAAGYFATVAETREEYGKGSLAVADVPAGVEVRVTRADGSVVELTPESGTATLPGPHIDGAATAFDFTYTNTTECAYQAPGLSIGKSADSTVTFNNNNADKTTGAYIKHHPWVSGAGKMVHELENFTVVLVGTMSPSPNTQFFHMGSSVSDNKNGLLIATTENDNEVLIAKNNDKKVDARGGVKASVPNAATARHAYVINKKGTVFEVWVDGVKRGQFDAGEGFQLANGGIQVGSDHGGAIKGGGDYQAVPNNADDDTETGCLNILRFFDYAISDAQAEAVFAEYPYVSQGGLYTRTVDGDGAFSASGAWERSGGGAFAVPVGATVDGVFYNPSATLDVEAAATMTVNADVAIDTLTVGGDAALTFAADGTHAVVVKGAAVVNSTVTIEYGAVNISGAPVRFGSSGAICFDCSGVDISGIYATTHFQLTGLMDRDDAKMSFVPPAAVPSRAVSFGYSTTGSCYEFVVTPDHEAGADVYYKSGTYAADSSDLAVVLEDGTTPTTLFPGDNVVFADAVAGENALVYFGETLPAGVTFSFVDWTGTVTLLAPGSLRVWTGAAGDGKMGTAGNWRDSVKPSSGDDVYFPATTATIDNDIEGFLPASITFGYGSGTVTIGGNDIAGVAAITNLAYASHTINARVDFSGPVAVAQPATGYDTLSAPHVVFAGGAYAADGCTIAASIDGYSLAVFGKYYFANGGDGDEAWYALVDSDNIRPALADGSELHVPKVGEAKELAIGSGAVFYIGKAEFVASPSNSPRFCYRNDGEVVVTGELTVGGEQGSYDGFTSWLNGGSNDYKIEKATCNRKDGWTFWFGANNAASQGTCWIGAGGINFGTGRGYFGIGRDQDGDSQTIRPWYGDFTIARGAGNHTYPFDIYFWRDVVFNTDDTNGVGRVITLNARPRFERTPTFTVRGSGKVVVNSVASNTVQPPVTVADTATLAFAAGASLTASNITVNSGATLSFAAGAGRAEGLTTINGGATLEVAEAGTASVCDLVLADNAMLAFNFPTRLATPVLAVTGGVTANGTVRVKVSDAVRPTGGKHVLTSSGGRFEGVAVGLAAGAPKWAERVAVEGGELVLTVKPTGTSISLR